MPLSVFDASAIPATDYSPLAGAPLERLLIQNSPLRDLSFLDGSPVKELALYGCNSVRGFAVCSKLKALNLLILPSTYRELPDEELAAIGALRSHPTLRNIEESRWEGSRMVGSTQSKDAFWKIWDRELSFVSMVRRSGYQFSLSRLSNGTYNLSIENQPLSDLAFLKSTPISELWLNNCKVADLSPIRDLPLRVLGLHANPVADVSPLRKMPLEELSVEETKISDQFYAGKSLPQWAGPVCRRRRAPLVNPRSVAASAHIDSLDELAESVAVPFIVQIDAQAFVVDFKPRSVRSSVKAALGLRTVGVAMLLR